MRRALLQVALLAVAIPGAPSAHAQSCNNWIDALPDWDPTTGVIRARVKYHGYNTCGAPLPGNLSVRIYRNAPSTQGGSEQVGRCVQNHCCFTTPCTTFDCVYDHILAVGIPSSWITSDSLVYIERWLTPVGSAPAVLCGEPIGPFPVKIDPTGVAYCVCAEGACSNPDSRAGCANSSGSGASLDTDGSASVAADDLEFVGTNLIDGQAALLFVGTQLVNGGAGLPFGDGLRCAGGDVVRLGLRTPANGTARWGPGLIAQVGIKAGERRRFQIWYRDPLGGPCGSGFNLSHAVEVGFGQ